MADDESVPDDWEGGAMRAEPSLWRAVRWPLLVVLVAGVAIAAAALLDRTSARELALTVGAPALTVLLPAGLAWLAVALVVHLVRGRRTGRPS